MVEVRNEDEKVTYSSDWKMTKPKCPFAKNCKAKIDKEHFEKYCCVSMWEACLFGFEGCPHYAKLRRKMAVEWQAAAQRLDKSIKEVR